MKNHLHTNLEKYFIANCVCACVRKSVEKYVFPIQSLRYQSFCMF